MGYQNLAVPRIYCNMADFLLSRGQITQSDNKLRTLPVEPDNYGDLNNIEWFPDFQTDKKFIALLGTNSPLTQFEVSGSAGANVLGDAIVNESGSSYAGFLIHKLTGIPNQVLLSPVDVGSYVLGYYYDFPHSPDLSLSIDYVYDGQTETTTRGGNTIVNSHYSGPSKWGDLGAWELSDGTSEFISISENRRFEDIVRTGRRVWRLNFSFLSDSSIWSKNITTGNYESSDYDDSDTAHRDTLWTSDTFFRVIQFVNGGQTPFLFQADGSNNDPDQFAIAKFDMDTFSINQTAPNLYSCGLTIKEIW